MSDIYTELKEDKVCQTVVWLLPCSLSLLVLFLVSLLAQAGSSFGTVLVLLLKFLGTTLILLLYSFGTTFTLLWYYLGTTLAHF